MQTFLPFSSFTVSAAALDAKRLNKQRLEVKQLLNAILGQSKGWANHPAAVMWSNYPQALALYGLAVTVEWMQRGGKESSGHLELFTEYARHPLDFARPKHLQCRTEMPWWLGVEEFHRRHRSALYHKDPVFYHQFNLPKLEMWWPNADEEDGFKTI